MTAYIERQSDAQFTLFLASLDAHTVLAERHVRLRSVEKKILKFHQAEMPVATYVKPEDRFTDRQMEIAIAAMANRKRNTNAADAAGKSIK